MFTIELKTNACLQLFGLDFDCLFSRSMFHRFMLQLRASFVSVTRLHYRESKFLKQCETMFEIHLIVFKMKTYSFLIKPISKFSFFSRDFPSIFGRLSNFQVTWAQSWSKMGNLLGLRPYRIHLGLWAGLIVSSLLKMFLGVVLGLRTQPLHPLLS